MPESDAERSDRDAQWAQSVRRGDSRAFEALFLAYYERLVRFTYGYLKTRSAAEEVVPDVFLNIWAQGDPDRPVRSQAQAVSGAPRRRA